MENIESIKDKKVLKVKDLMVILGIGKNSAYKLMQSTSFPSKLVGKLWIVSQEAFEDWLNNQSKE